MSSRRKFLQTTALTVAASGMGSIMGFGKPASPGSGNELIVLKEGIAGYTFKNFSVSESIAMMKRINVQDLSIKDMHLPLDSSPEKITEVINTFRKNGINIYAAGVIYMKTEQEIDRAFNYTKNAGLDLIIGVPNPELLDYTEKQVKAFNIRIAIHNHGPEDKLYPSPANVMGNIKNRDNRMGLCLDIGHSLRAGMEPVKAVKEYGHRIFDLHIKDLQSAARDAKPAVLGRGVIDIPGLVKALKKLKFPGRCSIEFEMDMTDPLAGMAESFGYWRGVNKTVG